MFIKDIYELKDGQLEFYNYIKSEGLFIDETASYLFDELKDQEDNRMAGLEFKTPDTLEKIKEVNYKAHDLLHCSIADSLLTEPTIIIMLKQ